MLNFGVLILFNFTFWWMNTRTWRSIPTQNNYSPLKMCHMSCSHSPRSSYVARGKYIPTHVKMERGVFFNPTIVHLPWQFQNFAS